jgi:hypothetical protein
MPASDKAGPQAERPPIQFDLRDPLFRRLRAVCGRHPVPSAIALSLVLVLPVYVLAWLEGVLVNPDLSADLASDVGTHTMFLCMNPLFLAFSLLYYSRFSDTIHGLRDNRILADDRGSFAASVRRWNEILNQRWLIALLYTVVLALCVIVVDTFVLGDANNWHWPAGHGRPTFASLALWPTMFLAYYLIAQLVLRITLSFVFLYKLLGQSNVTVQPLHPDGCGGLGPIGSLSLLLNSLVLFTGFIVVLGLYSNVSVMHVPVLGLVNILVVATYLVMSAVVVFSPIWAAHQKMAEQRELMLFHLNEKFERVNADLKSYIFSSPETKLDGLTELKEALTTVRELYEMVSAQPVWPFNAKVVYSFFGSIIWPVGFFLLQIYLQKAFG